MGPGAARELRIWRAYLHGHVYDKYIKRPQPPRHETRTEQPHRLPDETSGRRNPQTTRGDTEPRTANRSILGEFTTSTNGVHAGRGGEGRQTRGIPGLRNFLGIFLTLGKLGARGHGPILCGKPCFMGPKTGQDLDTYTNETTKAH